jgi:hypothetical protein
VPAGFADGKIVFQAVDSAVSRAQSAIGKSFQGRFDAACKLARCVQAQICGLKMPSFEDVLLGGSAHRVCRLIEGYGADG